MEEFSRRKQYVEALGHRIAYIGEGTGEPLLLLHGCPFHSYEWREGPLLSKRFRVLAPHPSSARSMARRRFWAGRFWPYDLNHSPIC